MQNSNQSNPTIQSNCIIIINLTNTAHIRWKKIARSCNVTEVNWNKNNIQMYGTLYFISLGQKKIYVCLLSCQKNLGSVGRD